MTAPPRALAPRVWLLALLVGFAAACDRPVAEASIEARTLQSGEALERSGFGEVRFGGGTGNVLTAHVYRATGFDPGDGPIWFVMHGASRNADRYVRSAAPVAQRFDALLIVVEFSEEGYPGTDYTVGLTRGGLDRRALAEGRWRDPAAMPYAEIERIFDAVRAAIGGRQTGYYLAGHSAGGQFTHRLLTFLPQHRVLGAVAINAGWYTLPAAGDSDLHRVPYGLSGSPLDDAARRRLLEQPLTVLVGQRDTETAEVDSRVRGTRRAMAQGASRLERGRFYLATATEEASRLGARLGWSLQVAPRARHRVLDTIDSAGFLLFGPAAGPCEPTRGNEAAGIVISELLADPPKGERGDANGDGERDPSDDEFVEIQNRGEVPVCLGGWALGDAENPERHVFPLDAALQPGERRVVFGGGVPTGSFGGATVYRTGFSKRLSLTNDGDVLTLRDAEDRIVQQVSWGDCAGVPCAEDHWPGDLDVASSLTRETAGATAGATGRADEQGWALHPGPRPFSPGEAP